MVYNQDAKLFLEGLRVWHFPTPDQTCMLISPERQGTVPPLSVGEPGGDSHSSLSTVSLHFEQDISSGGIFRGEYKSS